jgi:uncharacterized Zn finger protein (UPF0148 family)
MSDFDKEAERERLREKYEREQEKRESTERMSELLLKGATMTDAHCGNCGDPIFRYDGEEFCPTCQERVAPGEEAAGEDAATAEGDGQAGAAQEGVDESPEQTPDVEAPTQPESSDADAAGSAGAPADVGTGQSVDPTGRDANGTEAAAAHDGTSARADTSTTPNAAASQGSAGSGSQPQAPQVPSGSQPQAPPEPAGDVDDELGAARASLTRTLLRQARAAENCEDPRRAKDHLAAAREAAEALAALSY